MTPTVGFVGFATLTLLLLGLVVWTGLLAKRKRHLALVFSALASLGSTIFFAEKLGKLYDLDSAGWITPFHLVLAKFTVAAYLLPLVTGVLTWRNLAVKRWHRWFAFLVIASTLMTAVTGVLMILLSDPIPAVTE